MPEGWSKLKSIPPDLTQNFNNNKVSVYLPPDLRLTVDSTQYTLPDKKSNQSLREIEKRIYNKQELEQAAKQVCVLGSISKLILQQIDEKRCGYDVTLKFDLNSSITAEKNTLTADNKAKWQKLDTLPTNLFEGSNKDLNRFTYSEGLYIHGKMIDDKLQIVVTDKKPITVKTDETYHIQRGGRALPIANIDKGGNIQEQSAEAIIKRVTQYIGEYKLKSLIKDIYNTKADEDTESAKTAYSNHIGEKSIANDRLVKLRCEAILEIYEKEYTEKVFNNVSKNGSSNHKDIDQFFQDLENPQLLEVFYNYVVDTANRQYDSLKKHIKYLGLESENVWIWEKGNTIKTDTKTLATKEKIREVTRLASFHVDEKITNFSFCLDMKENIAFSVEMLNKLLENKSFQDTSDIKQCIREQMVNLAILDNIYKRLYEDGLTVSKNPQNREILPTPENIKNEDRLIYNLIVASHPDLQPNEQQEQELKTTIDNKITVIKTHLQKIKGENGCEVYKDATKLNSALTNPQEWNKLAEEITQYMVNQEWITNPERGFLLYSYNQQDGLVGKIRYTELLRPRGDSSLGAPYAVLLSTDF